MMQTIPKFKPAPLTRPTLDTPFHIDYEWWERQARDLQSSHAVDTPIGLDHASSENVPGMVLIGVREAKACAGSLGRQKVSGRDECQGLRGTAPGAYARAAAEG